MSDAHLACIYRSEPIGEQDARCSGMVPVFQCQHPSINAPTLLRKISCDPSLRHCQGCALQVRPDSGLTLADVLREPEGFVTRDGTNDRAIYTDVALRNEYRLPERFAAEDVILDVGAHIGSFAVACLERGAGRVISVEPVPENFQLLARNLTRFGERWVGVQGAIAPAYGEVKLTRNGDASNTVGWSVSESGEVTAQGFELWNIQPKGRVRLLKLDCEGCEYCALEKFDLTRVEQVAIEWHPGGDLDGLKERLSQAGFNALQVVPSYEGRGLIFGRRMNPEEERREERRLRTMNAPRRPRDHAKIREVLRRLPPEDQTNKWRWISLRKLGQDISKLVGRLPPDVNIVAGVARSGMIPASMLATVLHVPLGEFNQHTGELRTLATGTRWVQPREGRPLIIDDTIAGGRTLREAKRRYQGDCYWAAMYVSRGSLARELVNFFCESVSAKHLLEWNFFNNVATPKWGLDMDGIVCHDPDAPDADEGEVLDAYLDWLDHAPPRWLTRKQPVGLILTARLERWRERTEAWLRKWGVQYGNLVMHPADKASQRGDVAAWKAEILKQYQPAAYIESGDGLAKRIHELWGGPVICPDSERTYEVDP